jgi:uncharacterized caspase-like protein
MRKGRAFIIAFGVNSYSDPQWNLSCAANDARSYGAELVPRLKPTYKDAVFIPLISDAKSDTSTLPATKDALKGVLRALAGCTPENSEVASFLKHRGIEKAQPDDLVLLAFSCHGDTDSETGEYYLFPHDIGSFQSGGLTPALRQHGISSSELTDWLRDVDAGDLTMIIDACHSAAATGKDFKPGPMDSRGLGQLAYYKRMRLLSASQSDAAAKERKDLGHGLLTEALLIKGLHDGLAKQVDPADKSITLRKLLQFAVAEVPRLDAGKDVPRGKGRGRSARDISILSGGRPAKASPSLQTPTFQDFSRKDHDVVLVGK